MKVPFNSAAIMPDTMTHLEQAVKNLHISGLGPFSKKSETLLAEITGKTNLIVTSATHALEMMAILANIKPGDEVIVPSFTFVSTANAFALHKYSLPFA